jgi:GT2 family glycosyltransferase
VNDSPLDTTAVFVAYGMTSLPLAWIPPNAPVIVVHNDELLDEGSCHHPSVEHVHPGRNLGFGRAVDLAVERVRTRRVVICNPDMAFLPEHWQSLALGSEREMVTVRLLDGDDRPMSSVLVYPSPTQLAAGTFDAIRLAPPASRRRALLARILGSWGEKRRWAVETPPGRYTLSDHWVTGAVFSIDTALFRSVGGFDPGYFLYLEDTDLCRRLGRAFPDAGIVVAAGPPAIHQLGGSAGTPEAVRLVRRSQWDSAVRYARSQHETRWSAVSGLLSIGRWADRVLHHGGNGAEGQPNVSVLVHYGHHEGTTGSHFAEAAERLGLGTAIRSAHRSHIRLADVRSPVYLWVESGVTTIPLDAHLAPCLTAGYLIDTHLHLEESIRQAHLFDVVFVAQRDDVEAIAQVHPQVHWMPLAAPASFLSVPRERRYQASFVGNLWPSTPRREIMEAVSKRVTTNDWSRNWSVDQMARIYAASQVVVNPAVRDDLNMRFFEALACGAHVVMPPMGNGAAEIAVEGRDFFTCDFSEGAESVAAAVEEAVASSDSGDHGRELVAAGHTYDHRIRQVIDTCTSAHRSAPIRSMTETQRSAFLSDLAYDYKDLGIFRSAVRTSPRGVLDATRPWWDTTAQGTWKWAKERVKERSPEVAARLRQWRPVAADRH